MSSLFEAGKLLCFPLSSRTPTMSAFSMFRSIQGRSIRWPRRGRCQGTALICHPAAIHPGLGEGLDEMDCLGRIEHDVYSSAVHCDDSQDAPLMRGGYAHCIRPMGLGGLLGSWGRHPDPGEVSLPPFKGFTRQPVFFHLFCVSVSAWVDRIACVLRSGATSIVTNPGACE